MVCETACLLSILALLTSSILFSISPLALTPSFGTGMLQGLSVYSHEVDDDNELCSPLCCALILRTLRFIKIKVYTERLGVLEMMCNSFAYVSAAAFARLEILKYCSPSTFFGPPRGVG